MTTERRRTHAPRRRAIPSRRGRRHPAGVWPSLLGAMTCAISALAVLARRISPSMGLVDCGGVGDCGPLTLAFLLSELKISTLDGAKLRAVVVSHARTRGAQLIFDPSTGTTLADVILASFWESASSMASMARPSSAECSGIVPNLSGVGTKSVELHQPGKVDNGPRSLHVGKAKSRHVRKTMDRKSHQRTFGKAATIIKR